MGWNPWKGLLGIATGGISSFFLDGGDKKPKPDPYQGIINALQPLVDEQKKITQQAGDTGLGLVNQASGDYDYVNRILKSIMTGSDDELMKYLDTEGATRNINENEQQISELGVRGGKRAATLGAGYFDRDAAISKLLQSLRFTTPDRLAQVAQAKGNLGIGALGAATGSSQAASQDIFGVENLRQQDKDRRAAVISSIFGAIGGAAGAFLGAK